MWQKAKLVPPAGASNIHTSLAGEVGSLTSAAASGASALASLGLPGGSGGSVAEVQQLADLFLASASFLALTPTSNGKRVGDYNYFTPQEALTELKTRLAGSSAIGQNAFLLLLPAYDSAYMSNILAPLVSVYPTPELVQLLRRSGELGTLESAKFTIPDDASYPPELAINQLKHDRAASLYSSLEAEAALAEAVQRAQDSPVTKLTAFAQKRQATATGLIAQAAAQLAAFKGSFEVYTAYYTGLTGRDVQALTSSSPVGESYKVSAVLCWWGDAGSMAFLKDVFGV